MYLAEAEYDEDIEAQEAIFELMEMTTEALIQFAKAEFEMGANIVQCGDSLASLDVISPQMYKKYVFPYEKKFFEAMKPYKEKYDGLTLLHICGNTAEIMDLLVQTGTDILEVDYKVDLMHYKQHISNGVCLMGNLNPAGALLAGTPQDVEKEAIDCIKNAAAEGGFILGSGCEVAIDTPIENMKAMVRVARESKYPF